ncbi:NAD-dependent epimerase/dehydratase family protein [Cohnella zeiphila]|uniref:NAD(P)-dependent oxidoreductase n=1 Tax=Cohnella zeiphila TaxID=2761120 RepID=A0A7X0SGJ8_9BACL|nr:NAD(P)-dependent oxidoreductase [Cohnella zeiphila]MBB6729542.1 NAD(P)-dependent oxidoreductase [Cohnella zeiphila]
MRIAVTGGSGKLGTWVVEELLRQGYQVVSLDERRSDKIHCKQLKVDLSDLGQVVGGLSGADAVLHLAAIPAPLGYPDSYIFANNVLSTYNVLDAAAMLGIRNVVAGSSESVFGFAWAPKRFDPLYFPIDENHPVLPREIYGLSKEVGERTGEMFARRTGMQVTFLRYSTIVAPAEYERLNVREPERYKHTMWSYIDIRDAVQASLAALRSEAGGYHALNVTSDDTLSDRPTEELLDRFYPAVKDRRRTFAGREAVVGNALAKSVLGWQPAHSWQRV